MMSKDRETRAGQNYQLEENISPDGSEAKIDRKNPKTRKAIYALLTLLGMTGAIGGVIGFITGGWLSEEQAQRDASRTLAQDEFDISPTEKIQIESPIEEFDLVNWQDTKSAFERTFSDAVNYNDLEEIIEPLRQLAVNHTLYGAELLSQISKTSQFEADYQQNQVTINGLTFDLAKPVDFHLASAIIDTQLTLERWKPSTGEETDRAVKEIKINLLSLYYLVGKIDNLYFTKDSFLYFPTDLFVAMGKITQTFKRHDYPIPRTVLAAKVAEHYIGFYQSHDQTHSPFTVVLRANILSNGVIHEYSHFLQDAVHYSEGDKKKTEEVSLENYQMIVESAQLLYQDQVTDPNNQFVTDYAKENIKEDYAETFTWYFWHGDDLRARLEELKSIDPSSYQIVKTKYEFFKNVVFEGEEFANFGVLISQDQEESKIEATLEPTLIAEQKFNLRDVVRIADYDKESPGVFLRPQLITQGWYRNEEWPAVFDSDWVELLEGPKEDTYYIFDLETGLPVEVKENWWNVRITSQGSLATSLIGFIGTPEGWISERWLGKVIQSIE